MTNPNKDVISVLNDLIEFSKDGEKGFKTSADDAKSAELKTYFLQRSGECASAAAELQQHVRTLGGDPETSTSVSGDLHRAWVNLKTLLTSKDDKAVLEEVERGEDHALKAYKEALEKLSRLNMMPGSAVYATVERQYHGVQRNHDQVKAMRNAARASA
ncbi:PA2169 family four-helix-bundle protein [Pseudomonas fontis]|uniref:PA2169 family four-helix-bundle protein n=1 Tax=Pseudomonas fontis TaxID=2942633 RepID=A0ABT5NSV5_9PSED|nr:PA2169 family four-helix-bundle protein [Pseudomonas fontis]MDD0975199.1 PA2169 family four-helix-bundle protein [Pseudomonas fontis]MDD0991259.1 PA2169 family four-helix-bundle protein [Pseudomonas fontis]